MISPRTTMLLVVVAGVLLWVLLSPPGANDLVGGDEGYYGTMARNVLADPLYILSPSSWPLGPPGDKPPVYPTLLAAGVAALGPGEAALRIPSLALAAIIVLATGLLVGRATSPRWGVVCAALLVSLPWFANASRAAAGEIPLTAFALAGLAVLTRSQPTPRRALLAGALFGLAFLCKLWLVVLLGIPALAFLWPWVRQKGSGVLAFALAAVMVGALQLAALAVLHPDLLRHWWDIYFGFSLSTRLGGEGFADYWVKSPWFYWFTLTRAYVLLLPLVALGFDYTVRRLSEPLPRLLFFWGAGILILSLFRVKSGIYLYPVVPAWAALAAVGGYSVAKRASHFGPFTPFFFIFSAPPLARALGEPPAPLGPWAVAWIVAIATLLIAHRKPRLRGYFVGLLTGLAICGGLVREIQRLPLRYHDLGYREVATALVPVLADSEIDRTSVLAPEAPAFSYYLFRTAGYWGTPITPWSEKRREQVRRDRQIRAFVIDPRRVEYGGWPDSATVEWLERATVEVTGRIQEQTEGEPAVRVFVREEWEKELGRQR